MHGAPALFARDPHLGTEAASSTTLTPTLIIGIVVAILIFVGVVAWLVVRAVRKKASAQREEERGAAFLNVRGLVDEKRCACSVLRGVATA